MNLKSNIYGKIKLGNPVAKPGGEGTVYNIQNKGLNNLVAKIYNTKSIANQRHSKIAYMVRNNPTDGLSNDITKSIIWPLDALYDSNNFFVGFLMRKIESLDSTTLKVLTLPKSVSKKKGINWNKFDRNHKNGLETRLKIGYNLSRACYAIHESGSYVIVDLKPENVFIKNDGTISLVDLDSIQISDGKINHSCKVFTEEYSPPEKDRNNPVNGKVSKEWDYFSFGVILYSLLFGIHPFQGSHSTHTTLPDLIKNGFFVHGNKKNELIVIPQFHNHFHSLSSSLRHLFFSTFETGLLSPSKRASFQDWSNSLINAIRSGKYTNKNIGLRHGKPIKKIKTQKPTTITTTTTTTTTTKSSSTVIKSSKPKKNILQKIPWYLWILGIIFGIGIIDEYGSSKPNNSKPLPTKTNTYSPKKEPIKTYPKPSKPSRTNTNIPTVSAEKTLRTFFDLINREKYSEAYKLTSNKKWEPYNVFTSITTGWGGLDQLKIESISEKDYCSEYGGDKILNVVHSARSKNTNDKLERNFDFHLKKSGNGYDIVRMIYEQDTEKDVLKCNEIPLSAKDCVFKFLNFLDKENFYKSFLLTSNPTWGTKEKFVSNDGWGCISKIVRFRIKEIEHPEPKGSKVINAYYYAEDLCNSSDTFNLDFHLDVIDDRWQIVKATKSIYEEIKIKPSMITKTPANIDINEAKKEDVKNISISEIHSSKPKYKTSREVNVYSKPSSRGAAFTSIQENSIVKVIDDSNSSYWKIYYNGIEGYIYENYMSFHSEADSFQTNNNSALYTSKPKYKTSREVNVYSKPSSRGAAFTSIQENSIVKVIDDSNSSYWKIYYNGIEGYIYENYMSFHSEADNFQTNNNSALYTSKPKYKTSREVNVYSKPSSRGAAFTSIQENSIVKVIDDSNSSYWKIYYNGIEGYIYENYMSFHSEADSFQTNNNSALYTSKPKYKTSREVNVYSKPSSRGAAFTSIQENSIVKVIDDSNSSYWKIYYNGIEGYIYENYMSFHSEADNFQINNNSALYTSKPKYKTSRKVNVYSKPSSRGAAFTSIQENSIVKVIDDSNSSYWKIYYNGIEGFVYEDYLIKF